MFLFDEIPRGMAIFLIIMGLILGTGLIFGVEKPLQSREDGVCEEVLYRGYSPGGGKEWPVLYAEKYRFFKIEPYCDLKLVFEKLDELEPGTALTIYLYPNSIHIIDMSAGDEQLISFDEEMKGLEKNNRGLFYIGAIAYLWTLVCIVKIIRKKVC